MDPIISWGIYPSFYLSSELTYQNPVDIHIHWREGGEGLRTVKDTTDGKSHTCMNASQDETHHEKCFCSLIGLLTFILLETCGTRAGTDGISCLVANDLGVPLVVDIGDLLETIDLGVMGLLLRLWCLNNGWLIWSWSSTGWSSWFSGIGRGLLWDDPEVPGITTCGGLRGELMMPPLEWW